MQVKFSKFEKVAGLFLVVALMGMLAFAISVAVQKGWLRRTIHYYTIVENSEGIRAGSTVEMAGVRVGTVAAIDFDDKNQIRLKISIFEKFRDRVKLDTRIQLIRPFVVGNKALYLSVGESERLLPEGGMIQSEEVIGITEVLNGRTLTPYVKTFGAAMRSLKQFVDLMVKNNAAVKFFDTFERIHPLVIQMNRMTNEIIGLSRQLGQGNEIGKVVRNLASATDHLSNVMPDLMASTPEVGRDFAKLVGNMAVLTDELKKITPAISEVAPELPYTSRRLVEAIDEAVIVLKAMQKSFLLRSSAREVREEEAKERNSNSVPKKKRKKMNQGDLMMP